MKGHDRRLSARWAQWLPLTMASTASALSLANVQPITSAAVSLSCILAYNSPIPGCTADDFRKGRTCSAQCVVGLASIEYTIADVCIGSDVSSTSVLGQVLSGNLVQLLCPGTFPETQPQPQPTTPSVNTSPARESTTIVPPTSSTSSDSPLILTTVSSATSSSTSTTTTTTPTTAAQTDGSVTSTSIPVSTAASDTPSPTFVQFSTSSTSAATSSSTSAAAPQATSDNSSGGGSPFDVTSGGLRLSMPCWGTAATVALGLYLLLAQ